MYKKGHHLAYVGDCNHRSRSALIWAIAAQTSLK